MARSATSAVWTDIAVNLDAPPAVGQPPGQHGSRGAVYLGTIGKPGDDDVDTLWWFDGTSKWFKTGLRTDPTGVPAPVTAIVCDPAFPEEVYVGTTVGVWKGARADRRREPGMNLGAPRQRPARIGGRGSRHLQRRRRASAACRDRCAGRVGVAAGHARRGRPPYVRAHDDDLRYPARAVETQRDLVTARS